MALEAAPKTISPFAVFRNPEFTKIWFAQLVSTIGDSFTMIAAGIYIYEITGSALQVGLMMMATSIPTLVIGMIAGVFVDRWDRKRIMYTADLIRTVLILMLPFLLQQSSNWLYVIVLLASSLGTFFDPAFNSILPELATEEELSAANSMIAISSFGATAIGFAASGLIATLGSIEIAFYIDGVTFLISALLIMNMKVPKMPVPDEETNVKVIFRNLKNGLDYMFGTEILRSLFIVGIVYALMVGLANTLLLPFSLESLGATEFQYGLQEGLTSVGFVIGSLLMARYAARYRDGLWVIISLLGMGGFYLFYSTSTNAWIAIIWVFFSGLFNAPYGVARRTIIQRNTERENRGRVFGAFMTLAHVMLLIGMGLAGLADILGPRPLMIASAVLNLAAGGIALFAPGIGRPAADWLRSLNLLKQAPEAPDLVMERAATMADFSRLMGKFPVLSALTEDERKSLLEGMEYSHADEGSVIVRHNEESDAAYFILDGRAVAGREENGQYRVLEILNAGDFFGEIAALTGVPRTANVIIDQPSELLRVPASTLREMSGNEELNRVFMSKMMERMIRMNMIDLPKMHAYDQNVLKDLRTAEPQPAG